MEICMRRERRKPRILSPKERKEQELRIMISRFNYWFEDAVTPRLTDITKEMEDFTNKTQTIKREIREYEDSNSQYDNDGRSSESYLELFSEIGGLDYEIDVLAAQRLAIEEMKVVCLYKEFEILLKEIISISFPDTKEKDLFKWNKVDTILKSKGILVTDIINNKIINELRLVNNNIKHSSVMGEEISKVNIAEFVGDETFTYESLSDFYDRVRNQPVRFLEYLVKQIIDYLFVFDDERIDTIANEFGGRMEKETAIKLAEALIKKFK